jgi:hypothetical protein
MATAGRKESTPLAHTKRAVTTRTKGIRGGDMARTLEVRLGEDQVNIYNQKCEQDSGKSSFHFK